MLPSPEESLGVISKVSAVRYQTECAIAKGNDRASFARSYIEPFTVESLRLDEALDQQHSQACPCRGDHPTWCSLRSGDSYIQDDIVCMGARDDSTTLSH
jgi:hypothetical protein